MNNATLSSARLRNVRDFLMQRGQRGATTMEIVQHCHVCAVNSIAAELRECGVPVECRYDGKTDDGGRVYRYWILPEQLELF